jgi:hypothetical protein
MATINAYNLIQHSKYYDILEEKFHLFLNFAKEIEIKYPTEDIDREFYKILYEGGVISKEEMLSYIDKKPKRDTSIDTDNTIYFHEKPTDYELLSKLAKAYFGVSESDWQYVEPMFRAILDKGLDLDEDNIYVYTMLLIDISIDPEYAGKIIVDKLKVLDEFRDIEDIKDIIGKELEWEELAKALIDFLLEHVEKAVEDSRSQKILKTVLKL